MGYDFCDGELYLSYNFNKINDMLNISYLLHYPFAFQSKIIMLYIIHILRKHYPGVKVYSAEDEETKVKNWWWAVDAERKPFPKMKFMTVHIWCI